LYDEFHLPSRFVPEIAVDVDDVWDRKLDAMYAHASQFYEWLPWVEGNIDQVPSGAAARREWLGDRWSRQIDSCARASLAHRYGADWAQEIQHAETFQVSEYGRRPTREELEEIFPR
jgi:hypothetical protein